ncbi:Stk1 family PASTA domain-containing Ser/Thr kinase [Clostridium beijerinckii]|uniref:Stk1 family PASTA domain-containing Ser/Thr kinase n=1 Tax=Clostridium beijerinckii TaxID=1520 RepID=UPI0004798C58|nr:Stk1 family PASTA domain-containing Ser/Thr kinase [Clostridium beijerinckii]
MIGTLLINRYELLEKIGEGGMGIVYKAKCHLLNRFVAVKILKSELSNNEEFILRFKREANSIASLSHPNIVNIYDIGSENDINFIVMEYINGKTLKQVLKDNIRLSPANTLNISLQIAKALIYAHKNNIIHRDIKCDNILISDDNIAKLADFGIAKLPNSSTITNSNKIIGSVHYFSPEQAKGEYVDFRTDIYALGIVMYEMITGSVPFNGNTSISVAIMHIQEPVIPPKYVISDIPENINLVILKALEKDPVNRFKSAKEFANVLSSIKENPNFKIDFNSTLIEDSTVMIEPYKEIDPTVIMNKEPMQETVLLKNVTDTLHKNNLKSKIKKVILPIGLIAFCIAAFALGKYFYGGFSKNTEYKVSPINSSIEENTLGTTSQENNNKLQSSKKEQQVPLLVGKSKDTAESIINSNDFLLGTISYEYSDNVSNGLVISQSPTVGTSYEKSGKIDLIISQGQKITQPAPETKKNNANNNINNGNGNGNGKEKEKKQKNK